MPWEVAKGLLPGRGVPVRRAAAGAGPGRGPGVTAPGVGAPPGPVGRGCAIMQSYFFFWVSAEAATDFASLLALGSFMTFFILVTWVKSSP